MTHAETVEDLVREACERLAAQRTRTRTEEREMFAAWRQKRIAALSDAMGEVLTGQMRAILNPRIIGPASYGDQAAAVVEYAGRAYALTQLDSNLWSWRRLTDPAAPVEGPEVRIDLAQVYYTERADTILEALADVARLPLVWRDTGREVEADADTGSV